MPKASISSWKRLGLLTVYTLHAPGRGKEKEMPGACYFPLTLLSSFPLQVTVRVFFIHLEVWMIPSPVSPGHTSKCKDEESRMTGSLSELESCTVVHDPVILIPSS